MPLPSLTPLQYLTLNLLFVGPQTGRQLRRTLRALGVRQTPASFSRLMARLIDATYVIPQTSTRRAHGHTIRQRRYQITDLAVLDWIQARKFYVNLAPPSADLLPVVTDAGEHAPYDRADRDRPFQERLLAAMWQCVHAPKKRRRVQQPD
jgi:hypothetical protein